MLWNMSTVADRRRQAFLDWMSATDTNVYQVAKRSGVAYTTLKHFEHGRTKSLRGQAEAEIANAYGLPVEGIFGPAHETESLDMDPNNVRAWRLYRDMSLEETAAALGTTVQVLDLLEEGRIPASPKWLRRLSPVLRVRPGWLLDFAPADLPQDVLEIFAQIPEEDQGQALKVLETFKRTG